ncbi:molybdopterin molybdotransferase MoeA [Sulfolobus acidocaldarius]|uniref:Molybdopterin biosynthesis protein n=4 Tax=Sulfolobus acidocaldarius TaxID=2285 RepID=Q4JA45_SULAC|nr:molybdopterin molybdotransferase MoeA [Sulfolobus acidocaldarius]AAY80335.1 molybdopterin biosynthesis protein [Sulfolobus acidocaldarius DSM 639]AGE70916.1 putative molybdopterin biosynthesis protein MoeA/unknown domain fusion protein [Sulfolobus acidocaldarius N8]AGE73187.1 putative molybdopterin biosynthesis protein MoeA/unknown domain fusion protein [Sulfolobus acidocaldarius Ron12/I]ALU28777.1 molybdopterin biosynthesis protein MoeA [Sulfolobus acidocaldarius]ALU31497.1 molybdopterin b
MRAILKDSELLYPQDALAKFLNEFGVKQLEVERINLEDSLNRIVAEDIISDIPLPPFSRSTVDGFAIKHDLCPGEFTVIDKIRIGEFKEIRIGNGEAVEVDTGSPIPEGATAVVKVENTVIEGNKVKVSKKLSFGENIGWIGTDIPKGTLVVRRGERLNPYKIALLASIGIRQVLVYKRPRIYIIITGDELVEPGKDLDPGKIYESNSYYLQAYYLSKGYDVIKRTHVNDDKELIRREILEGIEKADIVIVTGGSSAGEKDYVHQVIKEEGKIIVHGLKIKPGKPAILAEIKGKPVFGLPGNITSTMVINEEVVDKYIDIMYNISSYRYTIKATITNEVKADYNRTTYIPVYLIKKDGKYYAIGMPFDSYMIGVFSTADGYIIINPGENIEEGSEVSVYLRSLDERPVYIGEEEPTLYPRGFRVLPFGSYIGLKAIKYGIGDVIVISNLYDSNFKGDLSKERNVIETGEGSEYVGYLEWVGLSKLVKDPVVKLRYPSVALQLMDKAKIIIPDTFHKDGKVIGKEKLEIIVRNPDIKKYFRG